jgi:hypothetical protein
VPKDSFAFESQERRPPLPTRVILGQNENEGIKHIMLKFFAYVLFCRERIQIGPTLGIDAIPFAADIAQLDYEMRVECGVGKLHELAVKVPQADIWVLKRSLTEARNLYPAMEKEGLRRDRYGLIGLDAAMFDEMCELIATRR